MSTRVATCKNCGGEIVGPAESTAPLPEIWLHESGGTSCHRVGHEQPQHRANARAEPLPANFGSDRHARRLGLHPEGLDSPEPPYCRACDLGGHTCPGCGTDIAHPETACKECKLL